jgi:hypothetical protein
MKSPWFDYLLVSKEEMANLLKGSGWQIHLFFGTQDKPQYGAVIVKAS